MNGDLTDEEIHRQLGDFAAHGVYGVVLHPRMGLAKRIEYLSSTYFHYIRTAVQTAAELGMTVVLYDEGMYPSGSACGQVVEGHPELASEGIALVDAVLPDDEVLAQTENGTLVVRKSDGTMRGLHWGEDDGEPYAPKTADILNPAAVNRFIELTHEAYYRELKDYFGNMIIGFFTDEPSILGRNVSNMFPWTHGFAELFTTEGGDLSGLAALFQGKANADTELYHKLILARKSEVYYGSLSRWCAAHGIGLMGHPHQSDDIEVEKYFAVPGQDLVPRYMPETFTPNCLCNPAQPKLRCARFVKDGVECWFLVNEGSEPIHTALTLPTQLKIGAYDLWNAAATQQPATQTENGVTLDFHLPVRGSVLLFACTAAEYAQLPAPHTAYALPCPAFELVDADPAAAKKVYRAHINVSAVDLSRHSVTLTTHAEEMAELSVNDLSAGVGFWSPQTFILDCLLHEGDNELTLTVTGSMANLHGKHPVWYGLAEQ